MSMTATVNKSMSMGGLSFNQAKSVTANGIIVHEVSIDPGEAGTLSTRTDADTGVVTVDDSGHSFADTDRVDIYWTGGCRRGMAVSGSPVGAAVTIDGGSGDDLPIQGTSVILIEPTKIEADFLGTDCQAILLYTSKLGQFVFVNSVPTEQFQVELGAAYSYEWAEGNGITNPITGDAIDGIYVSHGDTAAATMRVGILYNN